MGRTYFQSFAIGPNPVFFLQFLGRTPARRAPSPPPSCLLVPQTVRRLFCSGPASGAHRLVTFRVPRYPDPSRTNATCNRELNRSSNPLHIYTDTDRLTAVCGTRVQTRARSPGVSNQVFLYGALARDWVSENALDLACSLLWCAEFV